MLIYYCYMTGNAKLGNILEDLDIPDSTYNVGMSIFFIGYVS